MDSAQVIALLKRNRLFRELDDASLERLAQHAQQRRLPRGQTVVVEGEPGDSLGVVAEGRLRVVIRSSQGDEAELGRVEPTEDFGLVALLDHKARTASVETVEPSVLLVLRRDDVEPLLLAQPRFLRAILEALCGYVRRADRQYADQRFLTLKSRVAKALLEFDNGGPNQRFTQLDLANRVGATRQSVNQTLREFARRKFIEYNGRAIIISRKDELQRLASS